MGWWVSACFYVCMSFTTLHTALFCRTPWTVPSTSRMATANRRAVSRTGGSSRNQVIGMLTSWFCMNPGPTYAYTKTRKSFSVPIHWFCGLLNSWLLIDFYLFSFASDPWDTLAHSIDERISRPCFSSHYSVQLMHRNECANTRCGSPEKSLILIHYREFQPPPENHFRPFAASYTSFGNTTFRIWELAAVATSVTAMHVLGMRLFFLSIHWIPSHRTRVLPGERVLYPL